MIQKRIQKTADFLSDGQAAIIDSDTGRLYFTGFNSSAGTVIITKEQAYFLIDFRYFEKAKSCVKYMDVILCERLYAQTKEILKAHAITDILIETENTSVAGFERIKDALSEFNVSDSDALSDKISTLRSEKSPEEIKYIKNAQSITDSGFQHILNFIKPGVTEKEIALELEFFMRKSGSDGVAFDTIAVSGKNSSLPHGVPTDKPIEYGDFITLDFGAVCGGYCSDMTRTVAVGNITEHQAQVYGIVLKAQTAALDVIAPGKVCKDIDAVSRKLIDSAGYGKCFGHALGHSVGLEIHECPCFNTRDTTVLKPGTVLTVEPGIYIENRFGVRIEDMVLITENSFENLTNSPKELIIL